MRLIGIAGRSGSGKTLAAAFLAAELLDNGYTAKLEAFAVPVKREIRIAQRRDHIDKDTDRGAMQRYGAAMRAGNPQWFVREMVDRNNIDSALWHLLTEPWEPAEFLIIGDVRYPNEAEFIRKRAGVLWFVDGSHRPLEGDAALHESESHTTALLAMADVVVAPGLDHGQLRELVRRLVRKRDHLWGTM